jgi:hypothetical protein
VCDLENPAEGDLGVIHHASDPPDWSFERDQHDLVVNDE